MKKIQKEKVSTYDVFVAIDGTEFREMEECKKYEESAKGVLNAKYRKLVVKSVSEYEVCSCGSEDNTCDIVKINSQADADIVLQMYFMENPHVLKDEEPYSRWKERAENIVDKALKEQDFIIVGRGCCDCFWLVGTRNSLKESIDAVCTPEEKKD